MHEIDVYYVADDTVHVDTYTGKDPSRQLFSDGRANITFRKEPGVDAKGRRVLTAQYGKVIKMVTYIFD